MKKTTNTSLNNLFRAAHGEAEPNLVSNEEAKDLLARQVMHSVPSTQSIGQQLYKRLFSTPLKLGITAMTTASLITLGLLILQPGSSNTPKHIFPKPAVASSVEAKQATSAHARLSQPSDVATPRRIKELPATQNLVITKSTPPVTATPKLPTDSLKPFDLTVDQLAQLGITLNESGDIIVFEKTPNGQSLERYSFPPKSGVQLALGIPAKNVQGLQFLDHLPRLVTEVNGTKRMFAFERGTGFTKLNGGSLDTFQIYSKEVVAPQTDETPDSNRWVKVFDDSSTAHYSNGQKIQFNIDTSLKSLGIDRQKVMHVKVMVREDAVLKSDSKASSFFADELSESDSVVPPAMKAHLRALSVLLKRQGSDPRKVKSDNLPAGAYRDSVIAVGNEISKLSVSSDGTVMLNLKTHTDSVGDILSTLRSFRKANEEYTENEIPLDHLIPIRVRNNNLDHPNELIFWYEPSPELTNMLPKASYPYRAPVSQHLDLSVYPNPTNGLSNLHYALKDGKQAAFAVHDLLGKKLLDLGSSSNATGDLKIDLSSLEAGVYLLIATSDDGERSIQRIVLSK